MRGVSGGPDLCVGGTAAGAFTNSLPPANAFDDSASTVWYDGGARAAAPSRLSYDFGSPVAVTEIVIQNGGSSAATGQPGVTFGPQRVLLQWSDDGTSWKLGGPSADLRLLGNSETYTLENVVDYISYVGLTPPPPVYRVYWGGPGRIVGTTKIKGTPNTPVSRRVRLIREIDGVCVGERWSDAATGAYAFEGFDPTILYTVIVYDGPRVFRAAVQDAVLPEVYTP